MKRFIKSLAIAAGLAIGAAGAALGVIAPFQPGFALQDGTALNTIVTAVNTLVTQAAGTVAGVYTGTFNGTVGATTPSTGVFTTTTVTTETVNTGLVPDANDGAFIGTTALGFSDVFLATGGVINWNNGNTTLTQSTGALTNSGTLTNTGAITPTGGVAAAGGFTNACRLFFTGNEPAIATTSGTNLDIVTTETYRAEVFVPATCSSTGVAVFNGTAVAGNLTAYLIGSTGAEIGTVNTASTAASGTTAYQLIPWSGGPYTILGPATYWIAVQGNNSGGDLRTHVVGTGGADKQTSTTYGTLTVATAPTTFTTGLGVIASLY